MPLDYSIPELLNKILNSGLITQNQAKRLGVIQSLFFLNVGRSQTSRNLNVSLPFVDRWKTRWLASIKEREAWFSTLNQEKRTLNTDREFLFGLIADSPRSGTPPKFTEATKNKIIAIALQKPSEHGIPIERWSNEILAAYLIEKGIVETICSSSVSNFLKSAGSKSTS
jgi:hypothetical protein